LYTLLQILSVSIFEKTEVSSALQHDRNSIDNADNGNQLNLFNF
ncbi:MAG: IS4 family transposase, partial [Limnohabitans sp.]|nr:IS4 family transposase [Limnohabitans sp.]